MLLILSAALLPLGFTAVFTSLDTARAVQRQRMAAAQMATAMYAAQMDAAITAGLTAVRIPLRSGQAARYLCAALVGRPGEPRHTSAPIAVFDATGRRQCQSHGHPIELQRPPIGQNELIRLDADRGRLQIAAVSPDGRLFAQTDVALRDIPLKVEVDPGPVAMRVTLNDGASHAVVRALPTIDDDSLTFVSTPLAAGKLTLDIGFQPDPIRSRTILLIVIPILMWLAAGFTGWYIVNRLLLRPLLQLQRAIDRFRLGQGPLEIPRLTTPATEIQELAASFAIASSRILKHERELEQGLARQTRLTREVHHRVKNNLQVVSSLINLHARGATEDAAADAYAAIQRRVDALAVVHRNHFAELEENRGLSLRTLAGELASNLRASAPPAAAGMPIALNMISANVSQDVAVPVAFLITEVVELMMFSNPHGSILISLEATDIPDRARLRIETLGLIDHSLESYPAITRFDRVITGLARQLRAPLEQDRQAGRFEILISTLN